MVDWKKEVAQGNAAIDWRQEVGPIIGEHDPYISAGTEPMGSVITEISPQKSGAGLGTQYKVATMDDPISKIRAYAAARFPDETEEVRLKRYGIHNGEIVYQDKGGKTYRETPETFAGEFVRGLAEGSARLPTDLLAAVGAYLAGAPGAAVGGGTGELMRKMQGAAFGEQQTAGENLLSAGKEAAFAGAGERLLGGAGAGMYEDLATRRGGRLAKSAGRGEGGIGNINPEELARTEEQFRARGIEPYPPQTTESKQLLDKWELMEGMPRTSDILRRAKTRQEEQVQDAIQDFIDELGPDWTATRAGKETSAAAEKSIRKLEIARGIKVRPQYQEAFDAAPPIDTMSVSDRVGLMLENSPRGSTREKALKKIDRMLHREIEVEKVVDGELTKVPELVPEDRLRSLDNIKKEIDFMLEGPDAASIHKETKRDLVIIKNRMLELMDAASPDYKAARKWFEELSPPVTARSKGLIGEVAKLDNDKVHNAARRLLDSVHSSPESLARARFAIRKQNPDAWDAVVRTYVTDIFESIKQNVRGDIGNLAGNFYKKTLGDRKQRKMLQIAMGDKQFQNLVDFGDVLRKVSRLYEKNSTTASKQLIRDDLQKEGTIGLIRVATEFDITSPLRALRWINATLNSRSQEQLARAMVDPGAAAKLKRLRKLNPESKQFLQTLGALLGVETKAATERRTGQTDISIGTIQ